MTRLVARVDAWIFQPETAGRLRAMRVLLAALLGARVALGPYRGLAEQPAALFRPVWFLSWLDRMPSVEVILLVQLAGTAAALLAIAGWRERYTFATAWVGLLLLGGLRASRGKVMHNDVLLLLVAGVVVFAPVGVRLLDRRRDVAFGWPVRLSILVVGMAYFLTGFQKLISSGPAWALSDNLRNVMYRAPLSGRAPTDVVALYIADRPWLAQAVGLFTLMVEVGFILVLTRAALRPVFVAASAALHAGIYLTHGLDYSMWVATTAVVLLDWRPVLARIPRPLPYLASWRST